MHELAKACFCAAMADKDGRDRHVQSELTNGLSNRVVIGEMIGKDLKTADTPERLRAACDSCARARAGEAKLKRHEGVRKKMLVDGRRREPGPKAIERKSVIEAGRNPYAWRKQRRDHALKVLRLNANVAVRHDDDLVPRSCQHVDNIGNLPVGAMPLGVDHKLDVAFGKELFEAFGDRDGGISRALDP